MKSNSNIGDLFPNSADLFKDPENDIDAKDGFIEDGDFITGKDTNSSTSDIHKHDAFVQYETERRTVTAAIHLHRVPKASKPLEHQHV